MVPAYVECTPILVNSTTPTAARSSPLETIGLGPILGISTMLDRFDDSAMPATIGRKATPRDPTGGAGGTLRASIQVDAQSSCVHAGFAECFLALAYFFGMEPRNPCAGRDASS